MSLVTTQRARQLARQCIGLGLLLGAGAGVTGTYWVHTTPSDPRMEVACTMPRGEGEMTVATIEGGKLRCWRWR